MIPLEQTIRKKVRELEIQIEKKAEKEKIRLERKELDRLLEKYIKEI